jgi:gluconokinase
MKVLCFDIASGGLSAAVFDEQLVASSLTEIPWRIQTAPDGSAVLELSTFDEAFRAALKASHDFDAICFSAFMHNCVLLDAADQPLTPVFTWLDRRGSDGVEYLRKNLAGSFHERTGCRLHPMFPVFKLAALHFQQNDILSSVRRIASLKSIALSRLTGVWVEDHVTASASGLYNTRAGRWDSDLLSMLGLSVSTLPCLVSPNEVIGKTSEEAVARYGIPAGIPVIAGAGDGFLANVGSGCETSSRVAATLGTSASVRYVLPLPVLEESAGTFCYRADPNTFLLGCASSNGGNVLDWARSIFGGLPKASTRMEDLPIFIPLLNGERSPDWNPSVTASWHGLKSLHTVEDLAQAVLEGVVFNLVHYLDILADASGIHAHQVVLSGNGFLNSLAIQTLASLVHLQVLQPANQGLASLRGAAVCGIRGMGGDASPAIRELLDGAERVRPMSDERLRARYRRYREIRATIG